MKTLKRLRSLTFLFLGLILVTSCSDDDSPAPFVPTNSILELAQATDQLSSLEAALTKYPDLVSLLGGTGNFTVFAPNNDAFDALLVAIGQESIDDIPEDVLKNVLQYHVFTAAAVPSSAVTTGPITMANDEVADLVSDANGVSIEGAQVILADVTGTNGIVHVINNVIVPPSILPIVGTIVAPAYFNKDFSILIDAVLAADTDILSALLGNGTGNGLTLFAPTNAAFAAAGITDVNSQDAVLLYHVVDGTVMAADLPDSGIAAAEVLTLGGNIYVTNAGSGVFINGKTEVTATNIMGSNGVVHVIDRTLIPPTQDIVEIVSEFAGGNPAEFSLLAAALTKAGLIDTLKGDGPFTVFAPTDAAFLTAGVDQAFIDAADAADLVPILTHHVVEPSVYVFSSDVADGAVPMLNGSNVTISGLTILDGAGNTPAANLVPSLLDVHATNGVIHVIDKVLLPSS
ncbi:MAG: fasciclin domain-containing protein [Flavobacteriaceae bacterium]